MTTLHLGLRARIVIAVVLVTTTATIAMAFAVYRIQATGTTDRFTAAANAGFSSDLSQVRTRFANATGPGGRIRLVADYMLGRKGLDWTVLDFMPAPDAVRGRAMLTAGNGYYGPEAQLDEQPATALEFTGLPDPVKVATTTPWVNLTRDLIYRARQGGTVTGLVAIERGGLLAFAAKIDPDLVLVEFYDMRPLQDELSQLRRTLVVVAFVVSVLGVAAALVAASSIQRPVRRVAAAAHRLGNGAFDVRLPVRGNDEIAELTSSFNSMAERLGDLIEELKQKERQQQRFVDDVAHDLRTPTASLVAAADSLRHPDLDSRDRAVLLVTTQARRMARLVEDLLEISRLDSGAAEVRPEAVDLHALVLDAVDLIGGGSRIELRTSGDVTLVGDPRRLHTITCNLLANALHHGAEPVTVSLDGTDVDHVMMRVADSGPGVSDELIPILFDRFVRGDRARSATEGSGLGLAIARRNALAHHGRLTVHNDGGAVFTLAVPRGPEPDDEF
ncbi:sensor histidine kinase [Saccharopolyspora elongata]|uniref:histidine kinase n=1 Tax=Saccharopolyspora elongata TaxID=2530387 RepID=A0A4R4ZB38_9PSEU|nr:HAMP domain-containing sensor histidine kinase [Saccharopolyspora elongata]TDD55236.1 HAMP domain-containing histidine kinase [Saccharopolyspora elongata]